MEKNKEYTGEVLSLGSEGEGIINLDGYTVFVPFCLVGERVKFRTLKVSGKVAYGKLIDVESSSAERLTPRCGSFRKCGGCQLQHMSYKTQLAFKRDTVQNCLKKIGGITFPVSPCVPCGKVYGYRNKLAVPVGIRDGKTVIGFYAPSSHRIVPIDDCALQSDWSAALIAALKEFMASSALVGYDEETGRGDVRRLVARDVEGGLIITVVAARNINLSPFVGILKGVFKNFTLLLNINSSAGNAIFSDKWRVCYGAGFFCGQDMGIKYKAGANTFLQVNGDVRTKLYEFVAKNACSPDAVAIDLYSGGGMLTALLANGCKAAYGIEIVSEAVTCADELKKLNMLGGRMFNICGKVEDKLDEVLKKTDGDKRVIVCDPPRKGMERSVVKAVARSGADKVVLVSCNPATLARDLGLLTGTLKEDGNAIVKAPAEDEGRLSPAYKIANITPFDMFPQTKHVEVVVTLTRSLAGV